MKDSLHILVVDDDREIRTLLDRFLTKHGYRVSTAEDGRAMRKILADAAIDLIVLDLMMPGEDGLTLCRELRADSEIPVIMLTAMGEETDRIIGLEMGADDYIAKPFNPRELVARIKAVMRRAGDGGPRQAPVESGYTHYLFAGWRLDVGRHELTSPDQLVVLLSGGEFDLLLALVERPQRVLNRDQLLDLARGRSAVPFDRSVDVQISRLRKKIEPDPKNPEIIKTVRGGGYMLASPVTRETAD